MKKKIVIFLLILIISISGYILFNYIKMKNIKGEPLEPLPTLKFKDITFNKVDSSVYVKENDKLFLSDLNVSKYEIALDLSTIRAKTIYDNQDKYANELRNSNITVNSNFNYSSNSLKFTGYEITYSDFDALLFYVDVDDNTTLYGNLILVDGKTSYEDALDDLDLVLINIKKNKSEIIYNDQISAIMPGFENGENIIPFIFTEE